MGAGFGSGRRVLAICAVLCAVCGLVLAASAMPMVASESPASDLFDEGGGTSASQQSAAQPPAGADGSGGGTASDTGPGDSALGGELADRAASTDNPVLQGALYGLASLASLFADDPNADLGGAERNADHAASGVDGEFGDVLEPSTADSEAVDDASRDEGTDDADGSTDDGEGSRTDGEGTSDSEGGDVEPTADGGSTDGERTDGDHTGDRNGGDGDADRPSDDGGDTEGSSVTDGSESGDGEESTSDPTGSGEPSESDGSSDIDSGESGDDGTGSDDSTDGGDGDSGTDGNDGDDSTDGAGDDDATGSADSDGTDDGTDSDGDAGDDSDEDDAGAKEPDDGGSDESGVEDALPGLSSDAVTAAIAALVLSVVGYVLYRRDDPLGTLRALPGRLVSLALTGVVVCSQALERAVARLRELRSIAELPGLVAATLAAAFGSAEQRLRSAGASLPLVGGESATTAESATETAVTARERIRRAFESVIDAAPMYRTSVSTATPADVARRARNAGAPAEPVETITDSFRDVEYGDRDPESYLERTTTAHERLRSALEADTDEDEPASGTTEGDTDE